MSVVSELRESAPLSTMLRGMRSARSMRQAVRARSTTMTSVAAVAISHGSPGVSPDSSVCPAR